MILCLRYHPLKMSQKMLLRPKGNLSVKLQLWQHVKLTGIVVEIIVVVISRIIVWKQAMALVLILHLKKYLL